MLKERGMLARDKGRSPRQLETPAWRAAEADYHQPRAKSRPTMAEKVAGITTMIACNNQVEHTKNVCPLQNVSCSPSLRGISDSEVRGRTQTLPLSHAVIPRQ